MRQVVSASKSTFKSYPEKVVSTANTNRKTYKTIINAYDLAREYLEPGGRCACRYDSGLVIWVATRLATVPLKSGLEPPPTKKRSIEGRHMTQAPDFLPIRAIAQMVAASC
jgi:hypothetical protein